MANGTYTLTIVNSSTTSGSACVYVSPDDFSLTGVTPVAMYAAPATPTAATFTWTVGYYFVGGTVAASIFTMIPSSATGAGTNDLATLFLSSANVLTLSAGISSPGTNLILDIDQSIPAGTYSAGLGMQVGGAAAPVVITAADPSTTLTFAPVPITYNIALGAYLPGQVLDPLPTVASAEIIFPTGVTAMTATYTAAGLWTIVPDATLGAIAADVDVVFPKRKGSR